MFAPKMAATCYCGVALAIGVQLLPLPWPNLAVWRFRARADELDAIDAALARVAVDAVGICVEIKCRGASPPTAQA